MLKDRFDNLKRDTLLRRLLVNYSALSLSLLGVLVLGLWCLIWPHFTRIEKEESVRRVEAASRIVNAEAARVGELANTYAVWDDAYAFMAGRNPHFAARNLSASALAQIDVDAALLLSPSGQVMFSSSADEKLASLSTLEPAILNAPGLRLSKDKEAATGLLVDGDNIYFASTRKTVHTDGSGPANGSIVFLRRIDADVLKRVSDLANVELKVKVATVTRPDADDVRSSARLLDLYGRPVVQVDIIGHKEIADLGAVSLFVFLAFVVLAWFGTGAALVLFLGRDVIGPVLALRDYVSLRQSGAQKRFDVSGRPEEVCALAQTFDATFAELELEVGRHRKLVSEAEAARAAADEANSAKTRFLANMSHELRTPLSSIKSYAELLREVAQEEDRAQDVADIQEILIASTHLLGLVNGILDLSKVESGKATFSYAPVDLAELVRGVAALLRPLASQNGDEILIDVEAAPPCIVDEDKLRQCLVNLAGNAVKFTHHGEVRLSAGMIMREGSPWFCLAVQDTGIGISAEAAQRLFKPFSQADETTTRKYGGTGLGLALTKQLMEAMGGCVEMESAEGVGSTFRLMAPCMPSKGVQATLGKAA